MNICKYLGNLDIMQCISLKIIKSGKIQGNEAIIPGQSWKNPEQFTKDPWKSHKLLGNLGIMQSKSWKSVQIMQIFRRLGHHVRDKSWQILQALERDFTTYLGKTRGFAKSPRKSCFWELRFGKHVVRTLDILGKWRRQSAKTLFPPGSANPWIRPGSLLNLQGSHYFLERDQLHIQIMKPQLVHENSLPEYLYAMALHNYMNIFWWN